MKQFKDFNITLVKSSLMGDKIKMARILNKEIKVLDFRLEDSKFPKDKALNKCLYLQIEFENEKRVIFTIAGGLIDAISQIQKIDFPFLATIIRNEERFEFT
jgi:hypothetical protein